MPDYQQFYINGQWVDPDSDKRLAVINPATEHTLAQISLGNRGDVNRAVDAAKQAFPAYAASSVNERRELLQAILAEYEKRYQDIAEVIAQEMGAPITLATEAHAATGKIHLQSALELLDSYPFEQEREGYRLRREAIGVCGLITPWNWPINQIVCKVAPALAAGCTMVLKPTEIAPLNAMLFAEVLDAAGVPKGVFNLVNGDGPTVGAALSSHPDIAMVSFTGSTVAGVAVAKAAAPTIKRVAQELGGKSANIILDDADIEAAVCSGVEAVMANSGQTCTAPTRMLVSHNHYQQALDIARQTAAAVVVGEPFSDGVTMGPVVSQAQFDKIQALITAGIEEGATLLAGGLGLPDHLDHGYFVKPTIFADVSNSMTIAQQEIFGPVLCILPYDSEEQAIAIANDSPYGLSGYVQSGDTEHACEVAAELRTGTVFINQAPHVSSAPFGGYKHSGNGREMGEFGLEEFLETKAVFVV